MKEMITPHERASAAPLSPAIQFGSLVFISGQVGIDERGELEPDVETQTRQALSNLGSILSAAGLGFNDVLKTTVFLTDQGAVASMNEEYARVFPTPFPARSTVIVAGLPRTGARIEIEAVAGRAPSEAG